MTDNQVRDMVDITATIYKPYHADINKRGGFNILKIVSGDIATSGKEYTKKMHFEKKKIDFWVTFRPDLDVVAKYDKLRAEGSKKVCENIIESGSYQDDGKSKVRVSKVELSTQKLAEEHGEHLKELVASNPTMPMNDVAVVMGVSPLLASRVMNHLGLKLQKKIPKLKAARVILNGQE